ncbi:hypothetical protein ASG65_01550 [Bacillus sp. Leaf13]|nr:hypothetical protein ASG65_01550 [Bacillus sp. Leaf13]
MWAEIKQFICSIVVDVNNLSNVISYFFGAVASVMTLIGLLSIFISINIQQNIQKCRETIWNLRKQKDKIDTIDDLSLYRDIFSDSQRFTKLVVNTSIFSISLVILLITVLLFSIRSHF